MDKTKKEIRRFNSAIRQRRKLAEQQALIRQLNEELRVEKKKTSLYNELEYNSLYKRPLIKHDGRLKNEATAIALLSDAHCEERVTKESTNGLNEYNPDIFESRVNNWGQRLIKLVNNTRRDIRVDNLVLGLLGDNVSGYIHEELLETNYLSPIEASILFQEVMIPILKMISEDGGFKKIKIICKVGNHSRTSRRKKYSTLVQNSYEYILYKNIKSHFDAVGGYNNLEFIIEKNEFTYIDIYDKLFRFSHGDHFNYRGGVGGVEIPMKTWLYKMNSTFDADMSCIGHWHRHLVGNDYMVNASVKGFDAFAVSHGFSYEPATQQLQILDKKRGFTTNYKIFLD